MNDSYDVATIDKQRPYAVVERMMPVDWHVAGAKPGQVLLNQTVLQPTIELFNIPFSIRHGNDYVFVESMQWPSLTTYGKTAQEAIANMVELLRDVVGEYVFVPESELTEDAIEFRKFLIRKLLA